MKSLSFICALFISSMAFAQSVEHEVDSFGGNEALYLKAKALNPEVENEVVQNRFMERSNRFEVAPEFSGVFNGDSYNRTTNAGLNVHYHINPSWSVGVKYNYSFNTLTPEGKSAVDKASQNAAQNPKEPSYLFPQVIYPKSETLGLVNWYPIVGKLSFGKYGVAHFDTYLTAGYGQMELSNGTSPAATLGVGFGFWVNSNLTTRLEYRAQQYKAEYYNKTENMLTNVASVQMGWML
ncbi:outer membrane beta-barrel domain-containing protein [Bdellovibrio bacteriovorus]|uniref:Outer membrane beta-barrel domain-containing protein n=1 Tax=Bdellovibrio bacteriovorus TaxID=959 RepID=A0A150WKR4_BDEBC|nr:outer membrane beta-barrel domain-containing protein [Bdellovibrio bacteriovorus]KYG62731.1 outer membrane beta-barrel domain-containing protein [Bdellovibrio bacteriovorus]KYG64581.1 outer membrane beta-barrel domain-containing protein [Bdellovibrio bacteriovorus]